MRSTMTAQELDNENRLIMAENELYELKQSEDDILAGLPTKSAAALAAMLNGESTPTGLPSYEREAFDRLVRKREALTRTVKRFS